MGQQPRSGSPRGAPQSPRGFQCGSSSSGPPVCGECGRKHYGECWGVRKERAPPAVQDYMRQQQLQNAVGGPRGYTSGGQQQQQRSSSPMERLRQQAGSPDRRMQYVPQQQQQQHVAVAAANMYPAALMHPGSASLQRQQLRPGSVLPPPGSPRLRHTHTWVGLCLRTAAVPTCWL